jgi:hypothetical protein
MRSVVYRLILLISFLALTNQGAVAAAGEYRITPALGYRVAYDDNVFFKDTSDWEHRISPRLDVDLRTENSQIGGRAQVDISEYDRHSEFDTTDQLYEIHADTMPNERYQLSFSGSYQDDYTFVDALETSGIIADRSRRKRYSLEPGAAFSLSPRDTLRVFYMFRKIDYSLDRYNDTAVNSAGLTWAHALRNERTTLLTTVSASRAVYEEDEPEWFLTAAGGAVQRTEDVTQETLRLWLGAEHAWSETLDASLQGGLYYTESEFPALSEPLVRVAVPGFPPAYKMERNYDSGFILDGMLNWQWERWRLSLSVNRDVSESIYGEDVTRERILVSVGHRLAERWDLGCSAAYYQSKTEGFGQEEDRQTRNVGPSMTYRITERLDLRMGYRYTWTENENTNESEERNRIFAQLSMGWPITN